MTKLKLKTCTTNLFMILLAGLTFSLHSEGRTNPNYEDPNMQKNRGIEGGIAGFYTINSKYNGLAPKTLAGVFSPTNPDLKLASSTNPIVITPQPTAPALNPSSK